MYLVKCHTIKSLSFRVQARWKKPRASLMQIVPILELYSSCSGKPNTVLNVLLHLVKCEKILLPFVP
jgi:hypothetical protein